jgi:hypothetical protein
MAVCLEYQSVLAKPKQEHLPIKVQVAVVVILAVALASRIWVKHECTDLGYKLAEEKEFTIALDLKRRELELEHSVLLRRDSLENQANSRLKLMEPHPDQIIQIN